MTKSVKELIYDYLADGKEAYIAKKMRYFNQAQGMFNDIARDHMAAFQRRKHVVHNPQMLGRMRELLDHKPMIRRRLGNMLVGGRVDMSSESVAGTDVMLSDDAIRRRITKEQYALIHEMLTKKVYAMHRQTNFAEALAAYGERDSEHGAEYRSALKRLENNGVNAMTRLMHSRMAAMHGGSHLPGIAADFDGGWDGDVLNETDYIQMQSKEKPMNYTIKLLTTELFHNEVILLQNLVSTLNDAGNGYFCISAPSDKFEALLKSMADLGLSTLTVEDHEFISELMSASYFNLKKIKMTVTAPTEERRSIILTFVVTPERELVDVPAFAVEVMLAEDHAESDTLNRDIHAIVMQYHVMLSLIAAGIEYNHIPLRSSIVDRFLERRVYDATSRDRIIGRSGHALDLPTIMLTAGKSVEKLLANNILRAEYLDRMKSLGIEVAEMDAYDATAHFEGSSDHWMVHPVILDNLDQRITIAVTEDQVMDTAIPRLYEKALGTIEREKALRFAGEFFGTERLDHKAE